MLSQSGFVQACEFSGTNEDAGKHDAVEAPSVGVAQRRVIAAEQIQTVGQSVFRGMAEGVVGAAGDHAGEQEMREEAVPGDLAEADDDADSGKRADLRGQVDRAITNLLGRGLVAGRSATDDGGDPTVAQAEAVVAGDGAGFAGEAELVKDRVHEVAGAVSGEGTPGTVGAVGAGSEAEDEDAGAWIAEAGDGSCPVFVVLVGATAGRADAGAIVAQAGTEFACGDGGADAVEIGCGSWKLAEGLEGLRQWNLVRAKGK